VLVAVRIVRRVVHAPYGIPPGGIAQETALVDKQESSVGTMNTPMGYRGGDVNGYTDNTELILKRLARAEGQVRGIRRMVEEDTYCIDVLTQVSAATKALETIALALLDDHLTHCVAEATTVGGEVADAKLREASAAIARLVRS
jgi:DNA-binding FrmR family transcriptional regulator